MVITLLRKPVYLMPALAIVLLAASSAWLYGGKPHYPIVRAVVGEGVTLTFIDLPWNDVRKCEEAHKKVANLLRAQCPSCQLVLSECRQQLEPPWEKAFRGESGTIFAVHTDTQRIMIEAAHETAREICNDMAIQIANQGKQHARCVAPQS